MLYRNLSAASLARITHMDERFVYLEVLFPARTTVALPIKDYDTSFVTAWRPATMADIAEIMAPRSDIRPPANAPEDW